MGMWVERLKTVEREYAVAVAARMCGYCHGPCHVCPHFSPVAVADFFRTVGFRYRGMVVGYNLLMLDLDGVIEVRRGSGPAA